MNRYLRFGGTNPNIGILALRGSWPQRTDGGWLWPSFREESQLERLATENRVVVMPHDLPPLGMQAGRFVQEILRDFPTVRDWYGFFFSLGATIYVEWLSRFSDADVYDVCQRPFLPFKGVVICSGVDVPSIDNAQPRQPVNSVVVCGAKETPGPFGMRSCKETAVQIHSVFSKLGDSCLWGHNEPGRWPVKGHIWPSLWNQLFCSVLGIAA